MVFPTVSAAFYGGVTCVWLSAALAAAVSLLHLYSCLAGKNTLRMVTKPMLMPAVILLHISICGFAHPLVIAALIFGCVGDVFLMFVTRSKLCLVWGMLGFLIGHALYIISAVRTGLPAALAANGILPVILVCACALAIGVGVYIFLYKSIYSKLKAATGIYILALTAMAASMFCCFFGKVCLPTALMVAGGALFTVSDFILACRMFGIIKRKRINFWVMLTYVLAQTCLAVGFALVGAAR